MILGTRGSPLALAQTSWVRDRLSAAHPGLTVIVQVIRTTGDRQQQSAPEAPFGGAEQAGAKGIFVKEIEEAMLEGRVDAAVHSLKDLPTEQPAGLVVSCIPSRVDPRDALVTKEGAGLHGLRRGARVGTSSPRRASQLLAARDDLSIEPVRGNVETRIKKMVQGGLDAVVLAMAGLERLGLLEEGRLQGASVAPLPEGLCLPAVGQGALGIETRSGDEAALMAVKALHDPVAASEVEAERAFLAGLGGGCRVPVAALARATDGRLALRGLVASPDGSRLVRVDGSSAPSEAADLGRALALEALQRGARELLASAT